MSTSLILALVAVVVAIVAVIIAARRSGPRVTHIETRRDSDGDGQ
jgi:hypothetical protein